MEYKATYTICGQKGTGKTTLAFKFEGKKLCFSYDQKAPRIKQYLFDNSEDIEIIDGVKNYQRTPASMTSSAQIAYGDIIGNIKSHGEKTDWIIHDGIEKLHEICEMVMRDEFHLKPFEGFAQKSIWKYRRVLLANIHKKSLDSCKKGVIYTTFLGYEDYEIENGEVMTRRQGPKYFDAIEDETDVVFMTSIKQENEETKFMCKVVTSKVPKWITGQMLDVTISSKSK